jgi:hypothetical protein
VLERGACHASKARGKLNLDAENTEALGSTEVLEYQTTHSPVKSEYDRSFSRSSVLIGKRKCVVSLIFRLDKSDNQRGGLSHHP